MFAEFEILMAILEGDKMNSEPQQKDPWIHRSRGMRCKTCIWYVTKLSDQLQNSEVGRCRRHAPTMNGYPVVFNSDWCGDHRLDESKIGV